jgi:hypothetical protein
VRLVGEPGPDRYRMGETPFQRLDGPFDWQPTTQVARSSKTICCLKRETMRELLQIPGWRVPVERSRTRGPLRFRLSTWPRTSDGSLGVETARERHTYGWMYRRVATSRLRAIPRGPAHFMHRRVSERLLAEPSNPQLRRQRGSTGAKDRGLVMRSTVLALTRNITGG